jgi:hypothetical protein
MVISGTGVNRPGGGAVQEILTKSDDKSDSLYAVPFPQTERREMYVVVKPDPGALLLATSASGATSCPVGKWVTVTRADGWVPSTSVVWQHASSLVGKVFATVFWPASDRAHAADAAAHNSR